MLHNLFLLPLQPLPWFTLESLSLNPEFLCCFPAPKSRTSPVLLHVPLTLSNFLSSLERRTLPTIKIKVISSLPSDSPRHLKGPQNTTWLSHPLWLPRGELCLVPHHAFNSGRLGRRRFKNAFSMIFLKKKQKEKKMGKKIDQRNSTEPRKQAHYVQESTKNVFHWTAPNKRVISKIIWKTLWKR